MTRRFPVVLPILAALSLLSFTPSASCFPSDSAGTTPPAPLNERVFTVPVDESPLVRLKVTVLMPSRGGPFPLALINHGSSPIPANAPKYGDEFIPYYFLSRGYAVALPLMRGYAGSEGKIRSRGCDVAATGLDAAQDIRKVLDFAKELPGVDTSNIVVVGKSMGGWNTLAFGTLNPPDVKGLMSFAGGLEIHPCVNFDANLIKSAGQFGARTHLPSIWFFGENDQIFATPTWQGMFKQYTAAGAHAELVDYGKFQKDAHAMTASGAGLPLWVEKADAFLASIGMPAEEVNPEYLPARAPDSSSYADINDIGALPYLSDAQREKVYRSFLAAPLPRAIAIGRTSGSWASGGFDPADVAMNNCWKVTHYCQLYAVDNTVVWPRLDSKAPVTKFAALSDVSAVPYLDSKGRKAYAEFLAARRPRAFAVAPDGAWGEASGLDPLNDALFSCSNGHTGCRLYAVDSDVVWAGK